MYKMYDKKQWTAKIVTLIITTLCISGCLIYAVFACKGEDLTKVFAAESFSLLVNGNEYSDHKVVECDTQGDTITVQLRNNGNDIEAGTTLNWSTDEEDVIFEIVSQNDATGTVVLKKKSPGFQQLSVSITKPDGTIVPTALQCTIYIPINFEDDYALKNLGDGYFYGVKDDIVHLFIKESSITADEEYNCFYHYLRKVKYLNYEYTGDIPGTTITEGTTPYTTARSDVTPGYLKDLPDTLEWVIESGNGVNYVIDLDKDTGMIEAKSAGFATVKVKTKTVNPITHEPAEKSFGVYVFPEVTELKNSDSSTPLTPDAYLSANDYHNAKVYTNVDGSEVTITTNAVHADLLDWRIYNDEGNRELTGDLQDNIEISDGANWVKLINLKAGTYFIVATAKNENSSNTNINLNSDNKVLKYKIVVPIVYPEDGISLLYYTPDFHDTYDLIENSNLPKGVFDFTITGQTFVKQGDGEGVIEAVSEGQATVTINKINDNAIKKVFGTKNSDALTGYIANKEVTVNVYSGALLNTNYATIPYGSESFELRIIAPDPSVFSGTIKWESQNSSIASVSSQTGPTTKVKANAVGETTIMATLTGGGGPTRHVQCKVKVVNDVNAITMSGDSDVSVDNSIEIKAKINPTDVPNAYLNWTISDNQVANLSSMTTTPNSDGEVTARLNGLSQGTVAVTVTNLTNGKSGTIVVRVNPVIDTIKVYPETLSVSKSSRPIQLSATLLANGEAISANVPLVWDSNDHTIATVDSSGIVSFAGNSGVVYITVNLQGVGTAVCKITVLQEMEKITLDKTEMSLYAGESYRMTYTIEPITTSNSTLKWTTSDKNIATVDASGLIKAVNPGTCTIMVQSQDGTGLVATCLVTVIKNATSVKLDVNSIELNVGESYQLDAKVEPANSTAALFYESSNTKVAIVSSNGKITAKGKGNCVVFAKTGTGIYDYCYVEVSQQVTGLELDREEAEIKVGEMIELVAEVTPESASDMELEWTSKNEKVATVSQKGVVKGVSKGATIISCTTLDGEYIAICLVTVTEADGPRTVTITVNKSATVGVKKSYQLTATVDGAEVDPSTLSWKSSNKKIAKVTKSGVVKGVAVGKCKITVKMKDGSIGSAKCTVKVITATNDIELNKTYVEIVQGRTLKLKATTSPKKTTYSPLWESSDETIATVSKKGTITALKPGDCTIKCVAKDNSEVYAVCRVHVTAPVTITSFNFSDEALVMLPGETSNIQYTVSPSNYTEGYTWSSDNPVAATVDSNGKVTARAVGCAKITALSDSGKKSTMNVYVVGLSKTKITLHQYESTKINLEVDGVKTGELDIRWDTDNQSIAEMSKGKVTGKALGTTTVYCVVNGRYLACTVKVIKN